MTALLLILAVSAPTAPPVTALAFAPDGKSLLVGSQAGVEVRSWPERKPLRKLPCKLEQVHDLAFAPDGKTLAVAGGIPGEEGSVELFSWPAGKSLKVLTQHADLVHAVAWAADSKTFVSAGADALCVVYRGERRVCTFSGHSRAVLAVLFSPDGRHGVSAGADQSLRVWDSQTGKAVRTLDNHVGPVLALAARPGTGSETPFQVASASEDRTVRLWQPSLGRMVRFLRLPATPLTLAWSPDGKKLLAGCKDGRLRLIDPDDLVVLRELSGLDGWVQALAGVPDGRSAVLGGEGGAIREILLNPPRR